MSTIASLADSRSRSGERAAATTRTWLFCCFAVVAIAAAALVAHATATNANAAPAGPIGPLARASYVLTPAGVGIFAWRRHSEERLGWLLIVFAAVIAIWSLNGSSDPAVFGVARVVGVFVAPLYSYVVLSFPEGRLHSQLERGVVVCSTVLVALLWIPLVLITRQPVIATPLVRCAPHCPRNIFYTGTWSGAERMLELGVRFGYAITLIGVVGLLIKRLRSATPPMRRMLAPVLVASIAYAAALACYLATGSSVATVSGWIVIATIPIIPLALLVGLGRERLFVRSALARLVSALPSFRDTEHVRSAMAAAFNDESLQIFLWRAADRCYVDHDGTPVRLPGARASTAVTTLEKDREPVAAIVHDSMLAEDAWFVRAIAAAAMVGVERAQLEADLQVSRLRIVRAADITRERFERDLHDGAQQQLVAMRVRLQLAADAIDAGSDDAAAIVRRIGNDMDLALADLRRFAQGMYPQMLATHGLETALRSAALRTTLPTNVRSVGNSRYPPDVEAAVYFCCVEALQNATKHAGPDAVITVRLWCDKATLNFEVADTGTGFDQRLQTNGTGLTHMRDRIGAIGGNTTVSSSPGRGTSISGAITIADRERRQARPKRRGNSSERRDRPLPTRS